jgi:HSP20 family protein
MAKREKEGNGAKTTGRGGSQGLVPRPAERQWQMAPHAEHPLRRLRDEMEALFDRFLGGRSGGWEPTGFMERLRDVDVEEGENEIVVRAEAPGFEPNDFDIHVSGNTLTIRAEHKGEKEEKKEGYQTREWHYGRLERTIPLSTPVNPDKIEARYHSGVLELRLPRTAPSSRKRIEVKS